MPYQKSQEKTLLSIYPGFKGETKTGLLHFLLSAVQILIPRYWNTDVAPTTKEWIVELNHVKRMEELTASIHECYPKYKVWLYGLPGLTFWALTLWDLFDK